MAHESLARRFRPAGFEQPEGSRKYHTEAPKELQEAFDKWLGELPNRDITWKELESQYKKALNGIGGFGEIQYKEANSLLAGFKPRTENQKRAGLFVSACYTHSSDQTIIFDLDAPEIDWIGYRAKDVFNFGKVRNWFASWSSGLAINNGNCECWFAGSSSGLAINNGNCEFGFAHSSSGLIVTVREPKSYGNKYKGLILKPADCDRITELKNYLDELEEITKAIKDEESTKIFLEKYGPEPKERVEQDIKSILRNGGFEI